MVIMKIESSAVSLSSYSSQTVIAQTTEQLEIRIDKTEPNGQNQKQLQPNVDSLNKTGLQTETPCNLPDRESLKLQLLTKMIEALTGKKLHFYVPEKQKSATGGGYQNPFNGLKIAATASSPLNWSISYQKKEYYEEKAQMNFSAAGLIKTEDGRTLDIKLDLNLSRSFSSVAITSFTAGNAAVDPLVVNYGGAAAELTQEKYGFDLDNDGTMDHISFVKNGSGFLVLDKNADGIINNGSEMFGPSTGDGFLELKSYDSDGNGWIDENDPIYDKLQIWTKDEEGKDKLFAIGQVGIGAIYLGGISSNYELKDSSNTLQGTIRKTSIFLRENATAGTIQHIDLNV